MSALPPFASPPGSFLGAAAEAGLEFEPSDLERIGRWLSLLETANRRMNLTRITDPETAWHRHVLDSLSLLPILHSINCSSLLDLGSGGGAPGLPLAITCPGVAVGLVDSVGKKARFLED
ncbi:MAG: RsmG family class I SAM-dependent methyltransferase, partial [Planctomycetota bacterium]|nr:RsmG family class I SAM-dependent methyltransferase [Planctomycetota bacterium]